MWQSVADNWWDFTKRHEGAVNFMYVDTIGKVTTGLGYLIDSPEAALALPWLRSDGSRASSDEVRAEWDKVKHSGTEGQHINARQAITSLHLDDATIAETTHQRFSQFEEELRGYFPAFDAWPADAQMGVMSMAWAMGPNFSRKFPHFTAAVNKLRPDFIAAANESEINTLPPKEEKPDGRNADNYKMFINAESVLASNGDPEKLIFPGTTVSTVVKAGGIGLGVILLGLVGTGGAMYLAKQKGWI